MANPPLWVNRSKHIATPGSLNMAGISAGVKAQADVNSQPRQPTKLGRNLQNPATWAYIWAGAAVLYLGVTYLGIVRISRIG